MNQTCFLRYFRILNFTSLLWSLTWRDTRKLIPNLRALVSVVSSGWKVVNLKISDCTCSFMKKTKPTNLEGIRMLWNSFPSDQNYLNADFSGWENIVAVWWQWHENPGNPYKCTFVGKKKKKKDKILWLSVT